MLAATASLLHNNLSCSSGGLLVSVHNSATAASGKLLLHSLADDSNIEGPDVNRVASVRYLELSHGPVLCVSSTSGTQIYNEDCSVLRHLAPLDEPSVGNDEAVKHHQGACLVPDRQHIIIGTWKGSIVVLHTPSADTYSMLDVCSSDTCTVGGSKSVVSDLCYNACAQVVVSVHRGGFANFWTPSDSGKYTCGEPLMLSDAVDLASPVAVASLGPRIVVACGPGQLKLFDAVSKELQVEVTAHARWITALAVQEIGDECNEIGNECNECNECSHIATVGEDTMLNVWTVSASGEVGFAHSSSVTNKLLTGVAFHEGGIAVTAYDSAELYKITI
mmetsp:Transcript_33102/g.88697  ORF Transcript_33102/g.88697 Transcript_33102/m.88697 type:complete len:334 (-) Transcript_33102:64-1065(-)